jgi:hypothetical protein
MGGGLPPRGGYPHPRRQEPQGRRRIRRLWPARKHPPPGGPWKEQRALEVSGRAAAAETGAAAASAEPSRKRKRGFFTLR